jgi:hypothetical protein
MADADTFGLNKGACAAPQAAAPGCDSSGDSQRPPPTCRNITSQLGLAAELEGRYAKAEGRGLVAILLSSRQTTAGTCRQIWNIGPAYDQRQTVPDDLPSYGPDGQYNRRAS